MQQLELKPTDARAVLEAHIDADVPVLLTGQPGVGKSDVVRQITAARGWGLVDMRLSTIDAVDLRGLPMLKDGRAHFAPMGELPDAARDGASGVLFLDELPQAPMAVQNAAFSLVLDRRIGEYRLPPGWRVIAAGNRLQDRAGANRINSALANRFAHVAMVHDLNDWCTWALANDVAPELVAFMRFRPELLCQFNADKAINNTPRAWASVGRHLKARNVSPAIESAVITSLVDTGPASELLAFLQVWRRLPSPDTVLLNPSNAPIPPDGATLYALCGALARRVSQQSIDAFVTYIDRLPPEYGVLAMRDATARDPSLEKTSAAIRWLTANADVYL
jgi:hypothetical protein